MATQPFPQLVVSRKTGAEPFRDGSQSLPFGVRDFWQWSASDLASNATRGRVAEFLVAQALGIADGVRTEWDAYDLRTRTGATVEVKSAAYLQTWSQNILSPISFGIAPTKAWDPKTNTSAKEARRQADVYVFAHLDEKDKTRFDPLDVGQWTFYVLPTAIPNDRLSAPRLHALLDADSLEGAWKRKPDHRAVALQAGAVVFLRFLKKIHEKSAQGPHRGSLFPESIELKFIRKKVVSPETIG
jgi:hypothetical protein